MDHSTREEIRYKGMFIMIKNKTVKLWQRAVAVQGRVDVYGMHYKGAMNEDEK